MGEILQDLRPAALIRAIEANLFAVWSSFKHPPGVEIRESEKALWFTSGIPTRSAMLSSGQD